ncbi:MAG: elongation factor Ts [Rickettsiaceae bacterium]|nr:MAG: elongation factor Ts [Rickettsiaceae bacterium]
MVSALDVKKLREKTGAGFMDCKQALAESEENFETAVDWLRKKGLANATKKADRIAIEGLTAALVSGNVGCVIEVNSETDFVARNDKFQDLVKNILQQSLQFSTLEELKNSMLPSGKSVETDIIDNIATIGENINLRRVSTLKVENGAIGAYVHNHIVPNLGKIAVLVALESNANKEELSILGKKIAMHIAASKPQSLDIASLDQQAVDREREIFIDQTKDSGKPANIVEKMVEGRVRKFYEEVVLLEQTFVIDNKTKIVDVIAQAAKELGAPIKLTSFVRFELGQEI